MLETVLGFFCWPEGPASSLDTESDSARVESLGLFRVGGTLAVVGAAGFAPDWLLEEDVVGVLDTEVATAGLLVEAWGWSCLGVITALGVSSLESELAEATDTAGMNSAAAGSSS